MSEEQREVKIERLNKVLTDVTIQGITSLLCNRIRLPGSGQVKPKRIEDPEEAYLGSMYMTRDGKPGFPASGIKKAMVDAAGFVKLTKVATRGALYVMGDIVPIKGEPQRHEVDVRIRGAAIMRYRAEFPAGWEITFEVLFDNDAISHTDLINLVERAGFHIGIGDWRPQMGGMHGMFEVKS